MSQWRNLMDFTSGIFHGIHRHLGVALQHLMGACQGVHVPWMGILAWESLGFLNVARTAWLRPADVRSHRLHVWSRRLFCRGKQQMRRVRPRGDRWCHKGWEIRSKNSNTKGNIGQARLPKGGVCVCVMIWAYLEYVFTSIYSAFGEVWESGVCNKIPFFHQSCSHSLATCGQAPMNLDSETMVVTLW